MRLIPFYFVLLLLASSLLFTQNSEDIDFLDKVMEEKKTTIKTKPAKAENLSKKETNSSSSKPKKKSSAEAKEKTSTAKTEKPTKTAKKKAEQSTKPAKVVKEVKQEEEQPTVANVEEWYYDSLAYSPEFIPGNSVNVSYTKETEEPSNTKDKVVSTVEDKSTNTATSNLANNTNPPPKTGKSLWDIALGYKKFAIIIGIILLFGIYRTRFGRAKKSTSFDRFRSR